VPTSPVDVPTSPVDVPTSPVDVPTSPVDVPTSPMDVPTSPMDLIDSSMEIPLQNTDNNVSLSEPLFMQDSIKADIVPVIQNMIDVSSEKLFSLSIETLNQIFNYLETGIIPASEIESIILSSQDPEEIASKLQAKLTIVTSSSDTFKEDLITGILFNIPESSRDLIEPKLREIDDIDELVELSRIPFSELQVRLGFEAPIVQEYDERLDIIAGILAQLPPSLRGIIGDRLQEIDDIEQLIRLSQMNYVQIQQELGLAAQSPSSIPAEYLNPVDTATQSSESNTNSSPSPEASTSGQPPPPSPQVREMLRKRREENQKYISIIQKMAEKVWKTKITEEPNLSPEAAELKDKLEILYRIHPDRIRKILEQLKKTKNRRRFKALFYWYVYSHRIEEIETYVEHWQGQIRGIGGFRAAINVSRFDPVVEHLQTKEIEGINVQAQNALERIHSSNINVRARGVEDIKQIANYLLQKTQ
ncbi:MAG: hypothetical protein ACTSYB_02885, partial [Candidatus Helarchaeota archaeon]